MGVCVCVCACKNSNHLTSSSSTCKISKWPDYSVYTQITSIKPSRRCLWWCLSLNFVLLSLCIICSYWISKYFTSAQSKGYSVRARVTMTTTTTLRTKKTEDENRLIPKTCLFCGRIHWIHTNNPAFILCIRCVCFYRWA